MEEKIIEIKMKIEFLRNQLRLTDYQAIKYAEGELTEQEFLPMKENRKIWRVEINSLENELLKLKY